MRTPRLIALASTVLAAGCSLLVNPSEPVQCATDRDCQAIAALSDRTCKSGFCTADPATPATPDAGSGCNTTAQCTAANTGQPSVCETRGKACTPWQTPECTYFSGHWEDPNAIVIGSIAPFTVIQADGTRKNVPYAHRVRRAIDLAVAEFETEMPGGFSFPGALARPLAVVHCDSGLDAAHADAALTHLTKVVHAPAIILGADEDLEALTAKLIAEQVTVACSDCLGPLPPGPFAWRVSPPLVDEAPMVAWRVEQLETAIKAGPTPPTKLKVAVLLEPERAKQAFATALTPLLHINGGAALDASTFALITTDDARRKSVNHKAYADALATFAPDVVIVAMGSDFATKYLPLIESQWPAGKARPQYVMTTTNYELEPFATVLDDDDLRRRISGVRAASTPENEANITAFTNAYRVATNGEPPDGNWSGYEAFYALAYAVLATRSQPFTDGPHIAAGFDRLHSGPTVIDLRPTKIGLAAALLGDATTSIDLRGLWSDLDWDAKRDLHTDVGMYCFQRNPSGDLVLKPDAGPRRSATTGVVTGSYSCD